MISIIAVGKIKNHQELNCLFSEYIKRLPFPIKITEIEAKSKLENEAKIEETAKIIKLISPNDYIIILDEKGSNLTSKEFSVKLKTLEEQRKNICFILGGATGLDEKIKEKANFTIAFGKITLPHMFARTILVEQIYRAYTINLNHPYHK